MLRLLSRSSGSASPFRASSLRLFSTNVLSEAEILSSLAADLPPSSSKFLAFYSSGAGGIISDPRFMNLPMDDHMVHRGHGVFDTCSVEGRRVYGLDKHLARFLRSAERARVAPPANLDLKQTILDTIQEATYHAAASSLLDNNDGAGDEKGGADTPHAPALFCRYWLSAGRGDFGISPRGCVATTTSGGGNTDSSAVAPEAQSRFYCIVQVDDFHLPEHQEKGLSTYTVSERGGDGEEGGKRQRAGYWTHIDSHTHTHTQRDTELLSRRTMRFLAWFSLVPPSSLTPLIFR